MPRNIEIKAGLESVDALLPRARALADGEPVTTLQEDTFIAVARGRLKLRRFADGAAIAESLMRDLGLAGAPRLAGAYLDLQG